MDSNEELLGELAASMDRREQELAERLSSGRLGRAARTRPQQTRRPHDDDWLVGIMAAPTAGTAPYESDHRTTAAAVASTATRLAQLAASLESEPGGTVSPAVCGWLTRAREELEGLLASRPSTGDEPPRVGANDTPDTSP